MKHAKEVACQQSSTSTRASLTPELVVDMSFAPRAGEARVQQGESFGNWLCWVSPCSRFCKEDMFHTHSSPPDEGDPDLLLENPDDVVAVHPNFSGVWLCVEVIGDTDRFLEEMGLDEDLRLDARRNEYGVYQQRQKINQTGLWLEIANELKAQVKSVFRIGGGVQSCRDHSGRSPLLWPEVRAGCRSSAAAHSEQTNSSDELPHVRPFRSHEFLHGESPKSWLRGAYALVKKLRNCTTVRSCAFSWSFLALIFGARKGGPFESEGRRAVWENLWTDATQRMIHLRQAELLRAKATRLLSPFGGPQERKVPDEGSSVLLLSAHSAGYFQEPFVAPFVRQLECYAFARGMQFAADGGPWPLRHVPLGRTGHYFWVGHWHSTKIGADGAVEQEKWEEDHLKYVVTLVEDLQQYQLSRAVELASLENFVTIYFDDPGKQTKIWSIERQLDKHVMMVLYLDVDVTIRPDSLQWGLIPFLVPQSHSHRPGDVFVRDSWPGIECLNSGFLALRNTRASRLLLELWRQKTRWAASWDQSALAESILELVGMEMQLLGKRGYNSECLRFLLPLPNGVFPYGMYCDCWQSVLSDMIGPHRKRRSRIVTFVDPERIDVNFVPNDFFYAHGFDLAEMHLVSRANASTMNPLIVHWATHLRPPNLS
ncbi:unnamed protein product [Durusdinium trenchii]|uniref:Uncharacterized protein n=1 Tax=Durusdinium trenchii TaxID=1381693 RepID=A0ABP0R1T3_9DINO